MFSSLGRCRTGTFILAGTLLASGLLARDVRGLRAPDTTLTGVITTPVQPISIGDGTLGLQVQLDELHSRLKAMSVAHGELMAPFQSFAQGLEDGAIDDAAIWGCIATIPDPAIQDKYDRVMRDFAQRILAGQTGFELHEFPQFTLPEALAETIVAPELRPGFVRPKNLCNTCSSPSGSYTPTATCQYISGNTNPGCYDYHAFNLTAGTPYIFTFCSAQCSSATNSGDPEIFVYNPSCGLVANNDDFCGLQSQVTYTPTTSGVYRVAVTAYNDGSGTLSSYTMGYRTNVAPPSSCGTCAAPIATLTPTTTCQTVSGSNTTCPNSSTAITNTGGVWYNVNLTGGRSYTFSTCPNQAAGGSCFGTATYDTRLDLWNSTCSTRLAGNDDISGCSQIFRSAFLYTAPSTGVYKMQVRGFSTDTGSYTMGYQEASACNAPSITSNTPTTGSITGTNCSLTQTFSVGMGGLSTPPFSGTFSIVAPGGSSASPASGSMSFSGTTGSFTSTLTKSACGVANFTVTATIVNCTGVPVSRTWTYQLRDSRAPTIVGCPSAITLDCAAPDPAAPTLSATDNCDPAPTVTFAQTRVNGNCPGNFTTRRTWTARDCNSNTGTCTQNITHRDTTPPTISGSDTWCMWPANHEYYCINVADLSPSLADNCSTPVSLAVVGCVSNEPDEGTGDGDFPNDCIVSPDGKEICLRVERAGSGSDRVYGILGIAIDACGNRSAPQPIAVATVPHDDSEHPECRPANGGLDKHF